MDVDLFLSAQGFYGYAIFCVLSIITGLRYKNVIYEVSGRKLQSVDVVRLPAAMNLAGYLIPLKGGSVWLFIFLKKRYGFSALKSMFLSVFNLAFVSYLMGVAFLYIYFDVDLNVVFFSLLLFGYFGVLIFFRVVLDFFLDYTMTWRFSVIDAGLVVVHFLTLSLLCYVLVGPVSYALAFILALFLLVSALVKITPGNIGILEGAAIFAGQIVPDYGDIFPALVASFRSLSILHAAFLGVPSMISLSLMRSA